MCSVCADDFLKEWGILEETKYSFLTPNFKLLRLSSFIVSTATRVNAATPHLNYTVEHI